MLRFGAEGQFDVLQSRSVRGWLAATVGLTRRGQPSSVAEDYIDEDRPRDEADCFGTRSQPRGQKIPAAGDALVSVGGMLLAGGARHWGAYFIRFPMAPPALTRGSRPRPSERPNDTTAPCAPKPDAPTWMAGQV